MNLNDCYLCIGGDLNSHTKDLRDYVLASDFEQDQLSYDDDAQTSLSNTKFLSERNIRLERKNTDTRNPNNYGKFLTEFCKSNNLFICNGRIGSDLHGNATTRDGSVIDYLLACPEILVNIEYFNVQEVDNIFSDKHFRITCTINCPEQGERENAECIDSKIKVKKKHRNMWSNTKAPEFSEHLNVDLLNRIMGGLNDPETSIDTIIADMQALFRNAADSALGPETEFEIDTSKNNRPLRFDRETRNKRNKYYKAKRANDGSTEKKNTIIKASKEYKKAVSKTKALQRKQ